MYDIYKHIFRSHVYISKVCSRTLTMQLYSRICPRNYYSKTPLMLINAS